MTQPTSLLTQSGQRGRASRAIAQCRLIATISDETGRTTRLFLSPATHLVHAYLTTLMHDLNMSVETDAAGNLRGLWSPPHRDVPSNIKRLALGSHIDTVPDAGAFDGVLGVILALEWVKLAQEANFPHPIEVIAFSEEEGVRYSVPFLGSRAVAGIFDPGMLDLQDADGTPMHQAIRTFGLDSAKIPEAILDQDAFAFIEIHIEQGPVLEAENLQLAVVTGIVGQSRLTFRFTGQANHAGTTPIHLRKDALAAAAEWISAVETETIAACATNEYAELVATVGKIYVEPNAGNVIPGLAEASLDIRHMSDQVRAHFTHLFVDSAQTIANRRGLRVEWQQKMNEPSVPMNPHLAKQLAAALQDAGFPSRQMPSGAGHDAMILSQRVPTAMLFLRSPGGISHHPNESVREEDVEAAIHIGQFFLNRLLTSPSSS